MTLANSIPQAEIASSQAHGNSDQPGAALLASAIVVNYNGQGWSLLEIQHQR